MSPRDHKFGGDWTERKLEVLAQYLASYQTALKDMPFRRAYIDAFAGSGVRGAAIESGEGDTQKTFFQEWDSEEPNALRAGSARRALETSPPFDKYIFIEQNSERCEDLDSLRSEFPDIADRVEVIHGDANQVIQERCDANWSGRRAVLFLDPYGMQVEWATIEAIAETKAIDMWLLFPLGMGVNRVLPTSGEVPKSWRMRLDRLLGTSDWYDEFYEVLPAQNLWGEDDPVVTKRGFDVIGQYFVNRLKEVFPAVCEQPGVLMNSTNCPLYLLCFAAANEKGGPIATRIASALLRGIC